MLPSEILLEIFERMDKKSVLNSLLVQKRWNRIISESRSTMLLAPLVIRSAEKREYKDPVFTRFYTTVSFCGGESWSSELLAELGKVGQRVDRVMFKYCKFTGDFFKAIIACFPHLHSLFTIHCNFVESSIESVSAKCLRIIEIQGDAAATALIVDAQLRHFEASEIRRDQQLMVARFLNQQKQLQILTLWNSKDLLFEGQENIFNPDFNLKILYLGGLSRLNEDVLKKILLRSTQCEQLTFCQDSSPSFEIILKSFHHLTSLVVFTEALHADKSFYDLLNPIASLKHLVLDGPFRSADIFLGFISHFPNIETLNISLLKHIRWLDKNILSTMSGLLQNLTTLRVRAVYNLSLYSLKFPMIRRLEVMYIGCVKNHKKWKQFSKNNPNFKVLSFEIDSKCCSCHSKMSWMEMMKACKIQVVRETF